MALKAPTAALTSYPAWQPLRAIDHMLGSSKLEAVAAVVFDVAYSDHLPVAIEIKLPEAVELSEATRPVLAVESGGWI